MLSLSARAPAPAGEQHRGEVRRIALHGGARRLDLARRQIRHHDFAVEVPGRVPEHGNDDRQPHEER